jgi:hypothetical protein
MHALGKRSLAALAALCTAALSASPVAAAPGTRPPSVASTPELDSLVLFGTGVIGVAGYAVMRFRATRRRRD